MKIPTLEEMEADFAERCKKYGYTPLPKEKVTPSDMEALSKAWSAYVTRNGETSPGADNKP